ncbi:hypothetical protein M3Y97_00021000 [Aphelenchoides bicaudatus]|nr:hypothetical protein M3Y97_00021000 [Aphelenchoides bicaudatus]
MSEGSSNPMATCYRTFGSVHVNKVVFGSSVIGLIFCLIGGPIWHFFSIGFSFNVWMLFDYFVVIAAFLLVLLGNRRQQPYYYLPVLALMFVSLIYTSSIVYRSYLQVTKDVTMFKVTN